MDMKKMMKQAQRMQREAAQAQEEVAQMQFVATAGGGMVEVGAKGDMSISSVRIKPEALDPEDVEMLEDMILAAVNEALRQATEAGNERMSSVMGGMKIPGLM